MAAEKYVTLTQLGNAIKQIKDGIIVNLRLMVESVGNEIPDRISTAIDAKLRDQATIRMIVRAIINDKDALAELEQELHTAGMAKVSELTTRRLENLTAAVVNFYAGRDPDGDRLPAQDVEKLVEQLDDAGKGIVKGLRYQSYPNAVAKAVPEREAAMAEIVAGLCKARTSKQLIESNAALLVLEGLPLDATTVRQRLERDEDIASRLK